MPDTTDLDLTGLRTKAEKAGESVSSLQESVPGLLRDLKSSLVSIYAKDNPLIQAREQALQNYLSTPDVTRAGLLPENLPMVAGSPLTLSPTQQQSIVSTRQSAALAPLLGLNQAVSAGYGNIGDIVKGAGDIYSGQIEAARSKATLAQTLYRSAIDEYNAATARQEAERKGREQAGAIDPFALLQYIAGLQGQQQGDTTDEWEIVTSQVPQNIEIPGQGTVQPYTPSPTSGPQGRFNIFSQLGAIPELLFGRQAPTAPATSLNLLGQQNVGPFRQ